MKYAIAIAIVISSLFAVSVHTSSAANKPMLCGYCDGSGQQWCRDPFSGIWYRC